MGESGPSLNCPFYTTCQVEFAYSWQVIPQSPSIIAKLTTDFLLPVQTKHRMGVFLSDIWGYFFTAGFLALIVHGCPRADKPPRNRLADPTKAAVMAFSPQQNSLPMMPDKWDRHMFNTGRERSHSRQKWGVWASCLIKILLCKALRTEIGWLSFPPPLIVPFTQSLLKEKKKKFRLDNSRKECSLPASLNYTPELSPTFVQLNLRAHPCTQLLMDSASQDVF